MAQRIVYGLLAILVLVTVFAIDVRTAQWCEALPGLFGDLLGRGCVLPLALLAVVLRAAVELTRMLRATGAKPHASFAYLMIAVLMLAPWLSAAGWLGSGPSDVEGMFWQVVALAAACIGSG